MVQQTRYCCNAVLLLSVNRGMEEGSYEIIVADDESQTTGEHM